ncbi:MAG: polysaccharide biosynthesis protein [Isosphaeraceae bacterium]
MIKLAYRWVSQFRSAVAYALYAIATTAAFALSYLLRFELRWPVQEFQTFLEVLPVLVGLRLVAHGCFRLTTSRWRYVGVSDVVRLVGSGLVGSVLFVVALAVLKPDPVVPRSVLLAELVLTTYLTGVFWFGYRLFIQMKRRRAQARGGLAKRIFIIGAGEGGSRLAHEMVTFAAGYVPLGFIDDDPLKWAIRIHGVEVLGGTGDLPDLVDRHRPDELVVALPSLDPAGLRKVVTRLEPTGLPVKVLPGIADVLEGRVHPSQLREIRIEDLLGRDPVDFSLPALADDFFGKTVLITGAAGSIGAELARQVARHTPGMLILLDQAESALYFLELELRRSYPAVEIQPVVGDILDRHLIEGIFNAHTVHRTFHAAAYKHVPLMENNVREAVRNNVIGTYRLVEAAGRNGCERFVLISTDKAVSPVNVMGATKSMAELITSAAQRQYPRTSYMAVRFGNVLGSQGSVIPVFRQQLEAGERLTVTHPEVSRFFMTIPEASQLVLQASLLPESKGRIAMLDMGEPVRILDLARNLIRLSGETRDPDSRIRYVGLRPGEKLHEELVAPQEQVLPTRVAKVNLVLRPHSDGIKEITPWIDRWRLAIGDPEMRASLDALWDLCSGAIPAAPIDVTAAASGD